MSNKATLQEIHERLLKVEGQVEMLAWLLGDKKQAEKIEPATVLEIMTPKQHAALQMMLRGAKNKEIAERFGVTENTAKVYVRSIAKKVSVRTRGQIIRVLGKVFDETAPEDYARISGGLPKSWDATYSEPDEYARLYKVEEKDGT